MNAVNHPCLRIGNQTAYCASSLMEPFHFALANGFTAFEFFPDRGHSGLGGWAEGDLDDTARRWIRDTAQAAGMELTVHATLEFNPLHDPHHERLASTGAFATDIGATLVNLHLDATEGPERFAEALRPTLEMTAQAGLKLALENTVWTGPADFNALFEVLRGRDDLPSAHAGMCLDLGHANLFGEFRHDTWAYLDALEAAVPVIHLHLHENWGDRDSHLTLFTGPSRENPAGLIGIIERLRKQHYDGCAILEQWPNPATSLVEARDRLEKLIRGT